MYVYSNNYMYTNTIRLSSQTQNWAELVALTNKELFIVGATNSTELSVRAF